MSSASAFLKLCGLTGFASFACSATDAAFNGKRWGGIAEFGNHLVKGDAIKDEYTLEGGGESGSTMGDIGNGANAALCAWSATQGNVADFIKKVVPKRFQAVVRAADTIEDVFFSSMVLNNTVGTYSEVVHGDGQGFFQDQVVGGLGGAATVGYAITARGAGGRARIKGLTQKLGRGFQDWFGLEQKV